MANYDKESVSYDDWYQTPIGSFIDKLQTQLILNQLKPKPGMKILDVGCGTGNFSIKLTELGCEVMGIDISEGMLDKARKKSSDKKLIFKQMSATQLRFPDNYFDAIISVTAFEFIEDNQRVFNEMLRVCKSNGSVVVGTLHKESKWGNLYESDEMKNNSIFKYAKLKTKQDLMNYNTSKFISISECLHMDPTFNSEDFNIENEEKLKNQNSGGFICGLWKK